MSSFYCILIGCEPYFSSLITITGEQEPQPGWLLGSAAGPPPTGPAAQPPLPQPTSNGGACKSAPAPAPAPTPAAVPAMEAEAQRGLGGGAAAAASAVVPGAPGPGLHDPDPGQQSPCASREGDAARAHLGSAPAADAVAQADQEHRTGGDAAQRVGPEREGAVEAVGRGSAAPVGQAEEEGGAGQQARGRAREPVPEGGAAAGGDVALPGGEPQADPWLEPHGVPGPRRSLAPTNLRVNP